MKLTVKERHAITMLRKLDTRQRDKLLGDIQRQVLANSITLRVGGLRRLKIADDRAIEGAFGGIPKPKRMPRRHGDASGQT